jgi:hypothetical protein
VDAAAVNFPHGETIVRQRGTAQTDPYSGEASGVDWSDPAVADIEGCAVADGGSLEPLQDARNSVESDFDILAPFGSDVLASDRVVVRGLVCEVQGRPFDWRHPMTGWEPGMVIKARIVEG